MFEISHDTFRRLDEEIHKDARFLEKHTVNTIVKSKHSLKVPIQALNVWFSIERPFVWIRHAHHEQK